MVCLGFFDCMHKGHVTLLQRAKTMAAQCGAQVALFTFDNNHFRTLGKSTKLLYTFDERLSIYQSLGVQTVFRCTFDEQFRILSGERFLKSLLAYDICGVVCGADYTCGSDRMGAEQVKAFLKEVCPVEIVPLLQQEGEKVCSSLVRKLLLECRIRQANALLSQPFFFMGKVRHGRNVGEKMGFPTVNIQLDADKICPQGVYGGKVFCQGKSYDAIVNVGAKPTFDCGDVTVEAHILHFCGDLYGEDIKISLLQYLRPIQKFNDARSLAQQLERDVKAVEDDKIRSQRQQ